MSKEKAKLPTDSFDVSVIETSKREQMITIEASDEKDAKRRAKQMYERGEINWDGSVSEVVDVEYDTWDKGEDVE